MADKITPVEIKKNADDLGVDDLIEDIFGLNFRGLRTIWILITRPWVYFEAAKTPKWQDKFTPSFRIWFAIVALGTFFQFLWAGQNSAMYAQYVDMMTKMATDINTGLAAQDLMIDMSVFDPSVAAKSLLKYSQLFLPIGYLICFLIVAALFHSWGERLSFVVRLRYVFAIIIPGSILGFIAAYLTSGVHEDIFLIVNYGSIGIMFASYFGVAYFGAFRGMATGIRLGRSFGITALICVAVLVASVIAAALAFIPTMMTAFPSPVPLIQ